ncbi:hypothetical protein JAAARDRAFT_193433 [Jaapia argillacea MUCL 33604]|uniref:Major facilitator superfamily (MFS) profile domain-containing protein n=1 Tax=Jaapia argillacea MUCL 33604 TaxID=933084 RepID=A0A067PTB5_9AGAM|nr:hypothetical protein JAAARDRAFT_193433 [Jaapia argillacea MUCL 33604]
MVDAVPLSPAVTLVNEGRPRPTSKARKYVLLIVFCLAQFLDSFNNSALFSAVPALTLSLHINESESSWLFSAFQLTFASFLLVSGKISDLYNPKVAFIVGVAGLGVISTGAGFSNNKIIIIILRAFMGIVASLTIPSALTLLVKVFPEPLEQARAIGIFGGCGAIGNVLGLLIGALFTQYTSWSWVFWFVAIIAIPVGFICVFIIPPQPSGKRDGESQKERFKRLDIIGVSALTIALILFIFALTTGATGSWASAMVIVPLVISFALIGFFIYWETLLPEDGAAVPPKTWFLPNFSVLFGSALLPYFWWTTVFLIYTNLWQSVYHWEIIEAAIHMIPIGVMAFAMSFTGPLSRVISPKWLILTGQGLMMIACVLLALADTPDKYWPMVFPAFVLGSTGAMLTFTHNNIAIFRTGPPSMAGTVGAIVNGALQLGSAIGIAAVTSIETSVEEREGGFDEYHGRAAAFWFLLGIVGLEALMVALFYRRGVERSDDEVEVIGEGEGKVDVETPMTVVEKDTYFEEKKVEEVGVLGGETPVEERSVDVEVI